jgi:glycosyltransferase involved in cell wall biosynthesis
MVYVIDDGSTDGTSEAIEEHQASDGRINLIRHAINSGVGAAISTGYKRALDEGVEIMVVMDGHNQMDPDELPRLLEPVAENLADYAKGNRLYSSASRQGMSRLRFFGNMLLTVLTKISAGYWRISDPQNGYTAVSRRVFEQIPPDSIFPWYGYCNDLLVRMNVHGFRVQDVPIPARYGREKSKIRYGSYIPRVSCLLLKDFFWRLVTKYLVLDFNPLVIFYLLAHLPHPDRVAKIISYSSVYKEDFQNMARILS